MPRIHNDQLPFVCHSDRPERVMPGAVLVDQLLRTKRGTKEAVAAAERLKEWARGPVVANGEPDDEEDIDENNEDIE